MTDRFPLAVLPTPLVAAPRLARALGRRQLWIKRDDLTGFVVAGNKARQLEGLIGEALQQGADTLVTGGGPGSNFCAAAAAAARVAGLRCLLVLYGDEPDFAPTNLSLCRWHGGQVQFTGNPLRESVDGALDSAAARVREEGGRPYVVPRGGANAVGASAYFYAGLELTDQLAAQRIRNPAVLVAAGSGGTAAGLAAAGQAWRLVVAAVSRPPDETATQIARLRNEIAALAGTHTTGPIDIRDARGPGFGLASPEGDAAAQLAADTEGLLLDPVYSAKAFGVLLSDLALPDPVVFWHTGGTATALAHATANALAVPR